MTAVPRRPTEITRPANKEELQKALEKAIEAGEKRYARRILAIMMLADQIDHKEVRKRLKITQATLRNWIKLWNKGGLESLKPKKPKGAEPKLTEKQWEELKIEISRSPRELGYDADLWNTKLVLIHIKKKYGVTYHEKYIYKALKKRGLNLGSPGQPI